jgi:hypothetical protein
MKIRLLADYFQQRKKDADGVMFYVQRSKGDEFEVSDGEARALLREGDFLHPMAEKVTEEKTSSTPAKPTSAPSSNK